jgi:hypothetical protein
MAVEAAGDDVDATERVRLTEALLRIGKAIGVADVASMLGYEE